MSTLKRKLASRANGRLSRGPATPEGKRNSAANALHHGMLANSVVLKGEARERFDHILARFDDEYEPETETEQALVDMLAIARWRQMRLWGYEKAVVTKEISQLESAAEEDTPSQGAAAFRSLADNSRTLDLLNRYEAYSQRMFIRSHKQLRALKFGIDTESCETNLDTGL
jgi:hypothetical protein